MKLNQIIAISKILSDRKVPDDVEKFLSYEHYSKSKDAFIKYGDMDLIHFIRSHIKDSKRVWDDMSDKSDKLAEIKKYWRTNDGTKKNDRAVNKRKPLECKRFSR